MAAAAPEIRTGGQVVARGNNTFTQIVGVTPEYAAVRNSPVEQGQFISEAHVRNRSEVAVLGAPIAEQLFGFRSPIGQHMRISGRDFTVIGVLPSQGGGFFGVFGNEVLVPITTAHYRLNFERTVQGDVIVDSINVSARDDSASQDTINEITAVLRLRHRLIGENDFTVTSQEETIQALEETTNTFVVFLGGDSRHLAACGRHRRYEHNAGVGHRANARDRRAQGDGGQAARRNAAVLGGGHAAQPRRRSGRGRRGPRHVAGRWTGAT